MHESPSQKRLVKLVLKELLSCSEYTFMDIFMKYLPGKTFSHHALWDEMLSINLFERISDLDIPLFFLAGRYDYLTSFEVAEKFFHHIKTPSKQWIWFERSAHMLSIEEPEKLAEVMISKVLNKDH